jgi:hypothetical protein
VFGPFVARVKGIGLYRMGRACEPSSTSGLNPLIAMICKGGRGGARCQTALCSLTQEHLRLLWGRRKFNSNHTLHTQGALTRAAVVTDGDALLGQFLLSRCLRGCVATGVVVLDDRTKWPSEL